MQLYDFESLKNGMDLDLFLETSSKGTKLLWTSADNLSSKT